MRTLLSLILVAATLAPITGAAHEPKRRDGGAATAAPVTPGWTEFGYATYPRPDYGPQGFIPGYAPPVYAPGPSPGPRVYVYPHGTRVWYGPGSPTVTPAPVPPVCGSFYACAPVSDMRVRRR